MASAPAHMVAARPSRSSRRSTSRAPVTIPREFVFMERAAIGLARRFFGWAAEMNWRQVFEATLEGFTEGALAERQATALGAVGLV